MAKAKRMTGTVKRFSSTKGYGFIRPNGRGDDVFVHASAVEESGLSTLPQGAHVLFREDLDSQDRPYAFGLRFVEYQGELRFFKHDRGYGFIKLDEGGKDVFLHISAIEASGLDGSMMKGGVRLKFFAYDTRRGVQATDVVLCEDDVKQSNKKKKRRFRRRPTKADEQPAAA